MSDALPHVVIRSETGLASDTTITIDGQRLKGVFRYTLTHDVGPELPVLSIELYPGSVTLDHPAAVLVALERADDTSDAAPEGLHPAVDERLRAQRAASGAGQLHDAESALWVREGTPALDEFARASRFNALESRAIAGTQLEGVDVAQLAERYVALSPAGRKAVHAAIHMGIADGGGPPLSDLFGYIHADGRLPQFIAAVDAAMEEMLNAAETVGRITAHPDATGETGETVPTGSEGEE